MAKLPPTGEFIEDTLRGVMKVDHRGAAWCAGLCVNTVRHLLPAESLDSLRLCLLAAQGIEVSELRLATAQERAEQITHHASGYSYIEDVIDYLQQQAAWYAALAVSDSILNVALHVASAAATWDAAQRAASTRVVYAFAEGYTTGPKYDAIRNGYESQLANLIEFQLNPLPHPGQSVLADWLLEQDPKWGREGRLGDALIWARQRRLRWWDPAHRWAAEHRIELPQWWRCRPCR